MLHDERILESECVRYARTRGWACWKNENNGNKGIPDYSLFNGTRFLLVEFKKDQKQRLRKEQETWFARFPDACFRVDDFDRFKELIGSK